MTNFLTHLECSKTGKQYDAFTLQSVSDAGAPLFARYNLEEAGRHLKKEKLKNRKPDMWRYEELLPVSDPACKISLGEGFTPLRKANTLARKLGFHHLYIKDESINPTGSFKARGIAMALSAALERGVNNFAIPSAGNAAGALAAYAAEAGVAAHVFMPSDTPSAFKLECEYYGAEITLVDGLITDCGRLIREKKKKENWFDVSTLKEPYRLEGKKTMGLEIAEQLDWELPDVIVYPTGGGTGFIGMWKAFDEMERMGWIGPERPRMIAVQSEGCAPIIKAFKKQNKEAEPWQNAQSVASGIRVPDAIGDFLILDILYKSNGTAVAVSDEALIKGAQLMAAHSGIFPAPEGGATLAALLKLAENQLIGKDERIVLLNTGSGFKYMEALQYGKKLEAAVA